MFGKINFQSIREVHSALVSWKPFFKLKLLSTKFNFLVYLSSSSKGKKFFCDGDAAKPFFWSSRNKIQNSNFNEQLGLLWALVVAQGVVLGLDTGCSRVVRQPTYWTEYWVFLGSNPARCWAVFSFYPLSDESLNWPLELMQHSNIFNITFKR